MSLTPSELADHDRWATKQVEREAFKTFHPEWSDTNMISDESQKPTASHASLPVGVVDQMAAERAAHQKGERDLIDAAERARAAGPRLLAALQAVRQVAHDSLEYWVLEEHKALMAEVDAAIAEATGASA
jgi:hypothetical protein